jgi:NDP-mannose synthase
MEAVILAGGRGTRLKPYTTTLPKPLVPVGDDPILSIILGQLRQAGVRRVTLAVNHMAELIMSFFRSGERFGLEVRYSVEDKPLGTVGPLKLIENLPEHFLVMNGDILTDLDYADLYCTHVRSGAELTVATTQREILIDFGVLNVDPADHVINGFREKPRCCYDVSMGVYVFSRSLLERVPASQPYGFDSLVIDLLESGVPIRAYPFGGYWLDLGRPDDYDKANYDIERVPSLRDLICSGKSR